MYIYQRKEWPKFTWDNEKITNSLVEVRHLQGRLLGYMEALGFKLQEEASMQILTQNVVKTSAIEGENLDVEQVRSSIAKRLGINIGALPQLSRNEEGIVEIILDATRNFTVSLTEKRLFEWHAALFPINTIGFHRVLAGQWRNKESGPMQVISGLVGREKIHFEAPDAAPIKREMKQFLAWFNAESAIDLVIKSAIAHFWFVTIHPFEDGNGRIARAIADLLLARSDNTTKRFYSMSAQIQQERNAYYAILENSQKGSLDITDWLSWYLDCLHHAIKNSEKKLEAILAKANFWKKHSGEIFNPRQQKIINRLFEGFVGKLTSSKWAKINKCSQDTALRDINDLINRNILRKDEASGRSTNYLLVEDG